MRERKMRDWKMRHQNAEVDYAGLESARQGKVWNTASFLKYRMHNYISVHTSHVAQTALTATRAVLDVMHVQIFFCIILYCFNLLYSIE